MNTQIQQDKATLKRVAGVMGALVGLALILILIVAVIT